MEAPQPKIVLWSGPKHSGKTTATERLIHRVAAAGFSTAGVLAPALYRGGILVGFDVVDIATGLRRPLARRAARPNRGTDRFTFCADGFRLGNSALRSDRVCSAALVVVDEFGPLELRGEGWRHAVDRLVSDFPAIVLLVVREELADDVIRLYAKRDPQLTAATDPRAAAVVLGMLHAGAGHMQSGMSPTPVANPPRTDHD